MTLQIELGKTYLDRAGNKVGPMESGEPYGYNENFPLSAMTPRGHRSAWAVNGAYLPEGLECSADLVAEWVEPAAAPQSPAPKRRAEAGDIIRILPGAEGTASQYIGQLVRVFDIGVGGVVYGRDGDGDTYPIVECEYEVVTPSAAQPIASKLPDCAPADSMEPWDRFAATALAALIARSRRDVPRDWETAPSLAAAMADALMAERAARQVQS